MRGGEGTVRITDILDAGEYKGKSRLLGVITLESGCSIGAHIHENEEEIFLVLQGQAKVTDNGAEVILEPGDSIITRHGDSHSVACYGDETLVLLAAILPY